MKVHEYDFNELFQHHPIPGWLFDAAKNEIVELNQAAVNRYGYTKEEFQKLLFFTLRSDLEQKLTPGTVAHLSSDSLPTR